MISSTIWHINQHKQIFQRPTKLHCIDLEQVLIHFISENDNSASPLVIVRGQVTTRRRQMFRKAPSSSANKRLFGSSLSVDCQSVFHLRTSFPRDFRNGMSFSQNSAPFTLSDPAAVPYLL